MINWGNNLGEKMQMDENPRPSKADRKTIEKNRRNQMKALYSELSILVPNHGPRETVSLPDQLEGATNYIKSLQANLEEMKQKKMLLVAGDSRSMGAGSGSRTGGGVDLPNIDIRVMGSTLELVLITGLNCQFMFNDIIRLLHEEGAEVVNASFSILENTIFHTIHSKIGDSAQDYGAARISERLRKFVHDFS